MRIHLSDYFTKLGFKVGYTVKNRDGRMNIHLLKKAEHNGERKCIAYAKYIWMSYHNMDVPYGYEVDHINNDKTDDRIENLQILTKSENIRKSHPTAKITTLTCPICNREFSFAIRNLRFKNNPCCSVTCGRVKTSQTLKKRNLQKKHNQL